MSSTDKSVLTCVVGIHCDSEIPGDGIQVPWLTGSTIYLTNRTERIRSLVSSIPDEALGDLLRSRFLDSRMILCGSLEDLPDDTRLMRFLFLSLYPGLLTGLWLQKDNAASCADTVVYTRSQADDTVERAVYTGGRDVFLSAQGRANDTAFTPAEVKSALSSPCLVPIAISLAKAGAMRHSSRPELNRLERLLQMLRHARCTQDPGLRTAMYMVCLEILFSTDAAELSHKLGERCALFVGNGPTARLDVYTLVKKAYGIRSKVFHGDVLKASVSHTLGDTCVAMDALLRSVMRKVYSHNENAGLFLEKGDVFEDYFLRLVMGMGEV